MPDPGGPGPQGARSAGRLELREVTKRYAQGAGPAVEGLSLEVGAGEVCVLIGPSGCGKTTALKMINRLIEPTSGEILLDGSSVRERDPARLRREIGYVIQQVGLLPHQSVARNVATVPRLLGWDKQRTRARVGEMLALVGLDAEEYGKRYPAELSGGQQQRVGLARALAGDPPIMLMDEPFSAVDPVTRERLQNDLLRLHRAVAKTIVFVSHDIDEAVKMADRIAIMRDGRLVQYTTPAELLAAPADEFVADFVGSDRALKGLSLTTVEHIDLATAPVVRGGESTSAARARIEAGDLEPLGGEVLICDADHRPRDWMGLERALAGETVPERPPGGADPLIDRLATLRDAVSALFEANASNGVVVDGDGRCLGLVSVDAIQERWGAIRAEAGNG
jgi:osmoprotectant transport system ATP-binding protein